MNKTVKSVLKYVISIILVIALIAVAPVSRTVYHFYDNNRTQAIIKQLEESAAAAASAAEEAEEVNSFHKQAYVMHSNDGSLNVFDVLTLISDSNYELSHYEQTVTESSAFTSEYFHMMGDYTRDGNVITVQPGIGVLSQSSDGSSYTHYNAQFLTAEEAAGEKTREEVYSTKFSSNQIALMRDGTFVVGGTSDASDMLGAPAGRHVYTDAVLQGRVTFKTLITFEDGKYILYSQSTNSANAEQTTGAFFGFGSYEITGTGIAPDENAPEQTYDIVSGEVGRGFMYANNNGSHMMFDLQNDGSFSQWLATNFNAGSPTFYVTESGCTIKLGALKAVVAPWGLYVPAGDTKESAETKPAETETAAAPEESGQSLRLEVASSAEGKPFILELNAGGALVTGWTNYEQTVKEGTWTVEDGALVIDLEEAGYSAATAVNEDGSVTVTVDYGQMGAKDYTVPAAAASVMGIKAGSAAEAPAAEASSAKQDLTLKVESSVEDKPFILTFKGDGTVVTGWTNYEQTVKEGTWAVEDGSIVFDLNEAGYEANTVLNEDGSASITVNYGQMGDKVYEMPAMAVNAIVSRAAAHAEAAPAQDAPAQQELTLKVDSSVEDKPFILTFKGDGTVVTGWTNYEQTVKEGTWAVADGSIVFDLTEAGYEANTVLNEDGSASITVNYGQMGDKVYEMPAMAVNAIVSRAAAHAEAAPAEEAAAPQEFTLEVETSVEGKPFILTLKGDGTVVTGWTNYEQTVKEGTWAIEDGALCFDLEYAGYSAAVVAKEDGSILIVVDYGQMGSKAYTLSPAYVSGMGLKSEAQALTLKIESSVEDKPFILTLKGDGTVVTGWTNYEQTVKEGTWAVEDGNIVFDLSEAEYAAETVTAEDGSAVITVNYGQMGDKEYSVSAEILAALIG